MNGSPTETEGPRHPSRTPRRSRYLLAALLVVAGLAVGVGVGLGGGQFKSDRAAGFARVGVPGVLTLHVDRPASYVAYSEGTACLDYPDCHGQLYPVQVTVTSPTGHAVRVEPADGPTYMIGGMEGVGVATFEATTTGDYRVAARTGPYSEGTVAVGEAFPGWSQDWVAVLAMALLWAAGILIVVLPIVMYRRRRASAHSRGR